MIDKPGKNETDRDHHKEQLEYLSRKPRGAGFALFIASLALFFAAAGIAAGYKHWQRMHDRAKDNAKKIAVIEQALPSKTDGETLEKLQQKITQDIARQQTAAEQHLSRMAEMQTQTEQFAQTVTSQVQQITSLQAQLQQGVAPVDKQDWQVAEVDYLLKVAMRELHLAGNSETAKTALRAADQRLSEIGSPSYLPVRQQILKDLSSLETIQSPDIVRLSQQINNLIQQLQPVTIGTMSTVAAPTATSATDSLPGKKSSESIWAGYKKQMVNTFSEAILVRQVDNPLTATLSTEALDQLYNLIQLRLEALRMMALQKNDQAYHEQIKLLSKSIENYYPASQTGALLAALDELDAVNLDPRLPDISGSLRQLEKTRLANLARVNP